MLKIPANTNEILLI